jgi:putative cardiolipin synthase
MINLLKKFHIVFVYLLLLFILYFLITSIFIFIFTKGATPYSSERVNHYNDKVVVIEQRSFAAMSRINLIENATTSIKLAYYAVHDGLSADIFYGSILEAADRGVKVSLLFDGIFHNLKGKQIKTYATLFHHPNIEVKLYEPLNILKPWTINNRLHDKFIIVDDKYVLLGGRNIGDKYYLDDYGDKLVEDRDVLMVSSTEGVLGDFDSYFETLWNSKYTKSKRSSLVKKLNKTSDKKKSELLNNLEIIRSKYPNRFNQEIDWNELSLPTKRVYLVTNPIGRLFKEPTILNEFHYLKENYKENNFFQSPYIITPKKMGEFSDSVLITNSIYSSPNYFALSGYLKHRKKLFNSNNTIYEYYGEGSIHAKTYVFDKTISMVGSFNLDPRSAFLSTESVVVIESEEVAESLTNNIESLIEQSSSYPEKQKEASWYKNLLVKLFIVLLYPFDFLL